MPASDNGIVVGVVESLDDPDGLERVRVRVHREADAISALARIATPFAGKRRGMFFKPDVGDEAPIAFERGDPRRPYVIGSLWSKEQPPPTTDGKLSSAADSVPNRSNERGSRCVPLPRVASGHLGLALVGCDTNQPFRSWVLLAVALRASSSKGLHVT